MNWMQLTAALAQAFAWPIAALVAAITFHESLRKTLSRELKKVKAGPVELEWAKEIEQAEQQVKHEVFGNEDAVVQTMPLRLREIAKLSPEDAVVASFREIELLIRRLVESVGPDSNRSMVELVKNAVEANIITRTTGDAIHQLRRLRNLAVHERTDISYSEALEYIAIADAVMYTLDAKTR